MRIRARTHSHKFRTQLQVERLWCSVYACSWHFRGGEGMRKRERNSQRKISFVKLDVALKTWQKWFQWDQTHSKRTLARQKSTLFHPIHCHVQIKSSCFFYITPFALFSVPPPTGESINPRVAGLIGRSGPQNKQPFMVAFFKATEVHLRSIRSAPTGAKQRNPNRSKGAKSQEALRVANVAGKHWSCMFCT